MRTQTSSAFWARNRQTSPNLFIYTYQQLPIIDMHHRDRYDLRKFVSTMHAPLATIRKETCVSSDHFRSIRIDTDRHSHTPAWETLSFRCADRGRNMIGDLSFVPVHSRSDFLHVSFFEKVVFGTPGSAGKVWIVSCHTLSPRRRLECDFAIKILTGTGPARPEMK
eukprot:3032779-Pyramimonas_sp.AAC.1